MFGDVLVHHFLVELIKVLVGIVIIELALVRLDHVGAVGAGAVGERVLVARVEVVLDYALVLASSVHLVHEAASGRLVLLVAGVELTHSGVERFIFGDELNF